MRQTRHDITTKEDVALLIASFYSRVRQDPQLAPHFARVDWEHHTPIIISFWNMILFGDQTYRGNPFTSHVKLSLQREDFNRWLHHFTSTVDEYFVGEKAEEAKQRAQNIAGIFQHRLGL